MLYSWGVKAGMACLQVKLCVAISERFIKYNWYLKALYMCPGLVCYFLQRAAMLALQALY